MRYISDIQNNYSLFFLGIVIHNFGNLLNGTKVPVIGNILIYIGILSFIAAIIYYGVISFRSKPILYYMLLIATIIMWVRYDPDGYNGGIIQDINGSGATIMFLVFLCNSFRFRMRTILRWTMISMIIGLLFCIIYWDKLIAVNAYHDLTYTSNIGGRIMAMDAIYMMMPGCFFLCLCNYIGHKIRIAIFAMTILALVAGLVSGSRGYSMIILIFILESLFIYAFWGGRKRNKIISLIVVTLIILAMGSYFWLFKDTQFQMFTSRLEADSRSMVFLYWGKEMSKDVMNWIIGKGISGGYYDGYFGFVRPNIENGICQMLLKGGLLYLLSYMSLAIYAIYLSFFKSRNRFMKCLSVYVFTLFIFMFVWGTPAITLVYLNLWIAYCWIFNPLLRKLSDKQIRRILCTKSTY